MAFAFLVVQFCLACSTPEPTPPAQGPASAPTDTAPAQDIVPQPATTPAPAPEAQPPQAESAVPDPVAQEPTAMQPSASPRKATASAPTRTQQRPLAPNPATQADSAAADGITSITVEMLSRGKGVPDEARAAFEDIRALLERRQASDVVTAMQSRRMGLEGETRLCAQFRSRHEAATALADIRARAAGVELINVSADPCPSSKEATP